MYKVIINGMFESECMSFEERYDGLAKSQNLTLAYMDIANDFTSEWKKIADNPIESIEIQYDGQIIVTYTKDQYNLIQTVVVRATPGEATLEGTVSFTYRVM